MAKITKTISEDVISIVQLIKGDLEKAAGTTILITGSSGFLCSYFVDTIATWNRDNPTKSIKIIAVDNNITGATDRLGHLMNEPTIEMITHDVSKPLSIDGPIDWIIHGASIASPIIYRKYPLETIDVNVGGTRHLLDLAVEKKTKGFLVMSTSEIYGDPQPEFIPTKEDYRGFVSCTGPRACYDEAKRMAETLATTYYRLFKTPIKTIRPFNVYGPGQPLNDQRVIPDFITCVLNDEPIKLLSDGKASRALCYISDAVGAMLKILFSDQVNEAFNVGNDEIEISMADLAEVVRRVGGLSHPVEFAVSPDKDYTTDNPNRRCANITKIKTTFGWEPVVPLEVGIARTINSYREELS